MSDVYAVLMAGGRGERFWPASRERRPKQLLTIFDGRTLLEAAVDRLRRTAEAEHILIVTNRGYVEAIRKLCPDIPPENVIGEPAGRDTAPCVALAAGVVLARSGADAKMVLVPADPLIGGDAAFDADVAACLELAGQPGRIATIGVRPTFPSTAYGYIECGGRLSGVDRSFTVTRFREKPDVGTARNFVDAGNFFWNCGMFFWRCDTIIEALRRCEPALADFSERLAAAWKNGCFTAFLDAEFPKCRRISIDYAVIEHAADLVVREAGFDWDDVGNWSSLRGHFPADASGNVALGPHHLLDCRDNVVYSDSAGHLVCAIGVENLVIVHTADATLVCPADRTGELKTLLREIGADSALKKLI